MKRRGLRGPPGGSPPSSEVPGRLAVSKIETEEGVIGIFSIDLPSAAVEHALTDAEREIVTALLDHQSNAEIARRRGTSVRTVANQVASIFRKLGVKSRGELVGTGALCRGKRDV